MKLRQFFIAGCVFLVAQTALAQTPASQEPLLIIGASFAEGKTPFNNGTAPLGGIAAEFGRYLSLGQALTRNHKLPGLVINEAQAGASTFARFACATGSPTCGPASWDSYQTQFDRAVRRVALPPSFTSHSAKYVVITVANDCLHADAFGVPQTASKPCTVNDMNASVDRMIAVGKSALSKGITPIFDVYPAYESLDLPLFKSLHGLQWVISEWEYKHFREMQRARIRAELPGAIELDIWQQFSHNGDGLHPATKAV